MTATAVASVICSVYLSTSTTGRALKFSGGGIDVLGTYSISSGGSLSRNSTDGGHAATYGAIDGYLERMSVFGPNYVASGSESLRSVSADDFGEDYKYEYQRDYSDVTVLIPIPLRLGVSALRGMNDLRRSALSRADWLLPSATNISDTGWVTNNPAVFSEMASTGGLVGVYASTKDLMNVGGGKNSLLNEIIGSMNRSLETNYYYEAFGAGGKNPTGFQFSTFDAYTQAVFGDTAQYSQTGDSIMASGLRGRYILPLLDGKVTDLNGKGGNAAINKWVSESRYDVTGLAAEVETYMINFTFTGAEPGQRHNGIFTADKFASFNDAVIDATGTNHVGLVTNESSNITIKYAYPSAFISVSLRAKTDWFDYELTDSSEGADGYGILKDMIVSEDGVRFMVRHSDTGNPDDYDESVMGIIKFKQGDQPSLGYIHMDITNAFGIYNENCYEIQSAFDGGLEPKQSRQFTAEKSVDSVAAIRSLKTNTKYDTSGRIPVPIDETKETNNYARAHSTETSVAGFNTALDHEISHNHLAFMYARRRDVANDAETRIANPTVTEQDIADIISIFESKLRGKQIHMTAYPSHNDLRVYISKGKLQGVIEGYNPETQSWESAGPISWHGIYELQAFDEAYEEVKRRHFASETVTLEMTLFPQYFLLERDFNFWSYKWAPSEQ